MIYNKQCGVGMAFDFKYLGTAVDCEKEGHCLHEGTAVGSLYCCKCGQYIQTVAKSMNFYEQPYIQYLIEQGLTDIAEGKYKKVMDHDNTNY